jgi:chromosome segregation ATPase
MIEPTMYIAIGFLIACMLVIGVIPVVHARAVRLTTSRLEAATPMSMAEIQADKDQLRAEFAMATRRLEMSVEQMKAKTTTQLAEIGKKSEAIGRIKLELSEKTAALLALEAKEKQLTEELAQTQQQRDDQSAALQQAKRQLQEVQAQLATATASLNESMLTVDGQRVELVTVRAQVEVLKSQVDNQDKKIRELQEQLGTETADVTVTRQRLTDEATKADTLTNRVTELERQLVAQTTEAEVLTRRIQELVAKLDAQGRALAESEKTSNSFRGEAVAGHETIRDLRAQLTEANDRQQAATEALRNERTELESQLKQSRAERDKLHNEIASTKREFEAARAGERTENAVLRERLNEVAAEIARLTSALEGPGSPINAILAGDAGRTIAVPLAPADGNGGADQQSGGNGATGSLADRIRVLQGRAARTPQPSPS